MVLEIIARRAYGLQALFLTVDVPAPLSALFSTFYINGPSSLRSFKCIIRLHRCDGDDADQIQNLMERLYDPISGCL